MSDRMAVDLGELLLREGIELERRLSDRFWRGPERGDLLEAFATLPAPAGPFTRLVRGATIEGLWACLKAAPERDTLRTYFRWAAAERAPFLALVTERASRDDRRIRASEIPGGLLRLPGGTAIFRSYSRAVAMEFRRIEASFDLWAHSSGLLELHAGPHAPRSVDMSVDSGHNSVRNSERVSRNRERESGSHNIPAELLRTRQDDGDGGDFDPLAGWYPDFNAASLLGFQVQTFDAAGQYALGQMGIAGTFQLENAALQQQVQQLLLDQVKGIDATTADAIRGILGQGGDMTVAEMGQAISGYWDQASLSRGITIASTEMARASALAEVETYSRNGVQQVEFAGGPSGDECDAYLGEQYDVDSVEAASLIPVHPRCTHYWSPAIPDDWNLPTAPWAGGGIEPYNVTELGLTTPEDIAAFLAGLPQAEAGALEQAIQDVLAAAAAAEPGATAELAELADQLGGQMSGLDYRLKSLESLSRKMGDLVQDGLSPADAAADIRDALRYTMLFDPADYTTASLEVLKSLRDDGYDVLKIKNYWTDGAYRGINVVLRAPNGQLLELQFHTPESLALKEERLHSLYEVYRDRNTSLAARRQAWDDMVAVARQLGMPTDVDTLGDLIDQLPDFTT